MKLRRLALVLLILVACSNPGPSQSTSPPARKQSLSPQETAFLDEVQSRTFHYFWDLADPTTSLIPDRWPTDSFASIAASGFALTAYPAAVERGYITRQQAVERVGKTLDFFLKAPKGPQPTAVTGYQGFFYHFLERKTGYRFKDVELSTIDTTLLLAGALVCQTYFDGKNPEEAAIRDKADRLYRSANWRWMQARRPKVSMGWRPEEGLVDYDWVGYNEAMILLVLALGSPTYPIEESAWTEYTKTYKWGTYYGQEHVGFAPLFGHHFSHVWIDFRKIQDEFMRKHHLDYFENSRRAAYAQRSYAINNPMRWKEYGENFWGLSACDGPLDIELPFGGATRRFFTYAARGADFTEVRDDGTLTPAAAAGSLPFAPEITLPALMAMKNRYGSDLFSQYGFLDAFNPSFTFNVKVQQGRIVPGKGWFGTDYIGIDQGVLFAMIENYRSEFAWKLMRKNPYIIRGLKRAGFTGGWLSN